MAEQVSPDASRSAARSARTCSPITSPNLSSAVTPTGTRISPSRRQPCRYANWYALSVRALTTPTSQLGNVIMSSAPPEKTNEAGGLQPPR